MAEFHFIRPAWLLVLIPYLIMLWLIVKSKLAQGNWSRLCDAELLPFILQDKAVNRNRWPLVTAAIGAFLTIIAIAGPTWQRIPSPVFRNVSALVIILDLSRSMDAADIKPSRLIRARFKIADILTQRKDGQTALIVYAGNAFTVTPLTDDTETINNQLLALSTSIMPSQGSNTTLALQQAVALLKQSGLNQGDILLVSDGVNLDRVEDEIASLDSFRLSVLAVGTSEGAPIKLEQGGFLKTSNGEIVIAKLDIAELQQVASSGGGLFQLLSNDSSDSNNLIAFIDRHLETGDQKNSDLLLDQWQEQGPWLLLLVLPLAALSFRKGIICITFILLMPLPKNSYALEWQDLWQTGDQRGQQLYAQEKYEQAAEQFNDQEWKDAAHYKAIQYRQALQNPDNPESAIGWYNRGNNLAKSGQLQQAVEAYNKALTIDPNNTDAQYNKELVEQAIKEQEQEQNQQQSESDSDQNQSDSESSDSEQFNSEQSDSNQADSNQEPQDQKPEPPDQQSEDVSETDKQHQQQQADAQQAEPDQAEQEDTDAKPIQQSLADETQQANEQWLNRIPDNPAGLLRRKFKHQYGQRKHQTDSEQAW